MFRELRKKNQQLSQKEAEAMLKAGSYGVLAVWGDDGYPYAVPINYVYDKNTVYFHCAASGHKLDGLAASPKVSFCVVAEDEVIAEEFTTAYASVIVFGKARVTEDEEEKLHALRLLVKRFSDGWEAEGETAIKKYWNGVRIIALSVESMTGKAGSETLKRRKRITE